MTGRRVAITGSAAVTPLGLLTHEGFAERRAPSGIGPIRRFDARDFPVRAAAEVEGAGDQVGLGVAAARAALGDDLAIARLRKAHAPSRIGVFIGAEPERVAIPDWARVVAERRRADAAGEAPAWHGVLEGDAYRRRSPSRLTEAVAQLVGARGPQRTFAMACVSSAAAVAAAYRAVAAGEVTLAIAGGAARNVEPLLFAGFCLLGAMSATGVCRPFDARRDGFILADGAAVLVLEEEEIARAHGRAIVGRVVGAGASVDAYRMTDPEPSGRGATRAIRAALDDAGLAAEAIALVKAHATGTLKNDLVEAQVIHAMFGDRPAVLAMKGALGHSIAASGAVEAIAALAALRRGAVDGVTQLEEIDPALPALGIGREGDAPRVLDGAVAVCNTFGFGGINCALVIEAVATVVS